MPLPQRLFAPLHILVFVAGIGLVQSFPCLPSAQLTAFLAVALAIMALTRKYLPAVLMAGILWASVFASVRLHDALPAGMQQQDVQVAGYIDGLPDKRDADIRFDFNIDHAGGAIPVPGHIRLTWYRAPYDLKAGEYWRLNVRLKPPHGFANPGSMDYEQWLFSQGIGATGYVRENPENGKLEESSALSIQRWRQWLNDQIDLHLQHSDMRGVVKALVLGNEQDITQDQWTVLRRTGTAHLIAISGSHISLIAGFCFFWTRRLCAAIGLMRWPPSAVAVVAAVFASVLYAGLADFAIPTRRALIMVALAMGAIFLQRNTRPLQVLMLALLLVTLHDPTAILSAGFWLSFAAIGIILYAAAGQLGSAGWWADLWKINWATSLGLAPLTLLFFQQVSLISPLANLLAIPVLGVLAIPLCLVAALLLPVVPAAGDFLLRGTEFLLHGFWPLLQWMASLSWVQWTHSAPPLWTLLFAVPGVILLLAPRATPGRWLGLMLWLPALSQVPERPPKDGFRLTLLDVGQGLSAVVETQAHNLVFDTGARMGPGFDMGAAVVEPFLRNSGIDTLDTLVISHGDNDHIGGAYSLHERVNILQTLTSVPERLNGFSPLRCRAGQSWEWDGVRFEMLSPDGDDDAVATRKENDNSCVLRVVGGNSCALLTADIEKEAESRLLDIYGAGLKCRVLVVPHHGSNTSSTGEFLAAVRPEYALIPAGFLNRFNFPRPQVMQRYQTQGALVLNTAEEGAIRVEFAPDGGLVIDRYRSSHARYWNAR